ncbi:MAG: hypothetical protein PVH17_01585 [Anaerolineae bacterium]|jgi:hypothetical protein
MTGVGTSAYRCSPGIAWVKDAEQTLLIQEEKRRSWSLCGAEAVVWDLLVLAYPFPQTVRFFSALFACTTQEAEEILRTMLGEWEEKGIVCAVEGNQGG